MKNNNSASTDGIPAEVLKETGPTLIDNEENMVCNTSIICPSMRESVLIQFAIHEIIVLIGAITIPDYMIRIGTSTSRLVYNRLLNVGLFRLYCGGCGQQHSI